MRRPLFTILWLLSIVGTLVAATAASMCRVDSDCVGYNGSLFCGSVICSQGECLPGPSPCTSQCLESERRCVECLSHSDCFVQGFVCDPLTHTCHGCETNTDCPIGSWCTGGHWQCSRGKCYPPPASRQPCSDMSRCDEAAHRCSRCDHNEDCGTWDYCQNRVHCDVATSTCVQEAPLPSNCRYCDSRLQRCFECIADSDCETSQFANNQPFCSPPTRVQACQEGTCVVIPNSQVSAWKSPCENSAQECSESRKRCTNKLCLDNRDASCSDGNDCNGLERCEQQVCQPPLVTSCPQGQICNPWNMTQCVSEPAYKQSQTATIGATRQSAGIISVVAVKGEQYRETDLPCEQHSECPNNWLCRVISRATNRLKACRPCRNDAQCIHDESPEGRTATCDKETGSCSSRQTTHSRVITLSIVRPSTLAQHLTIRPTSNSSNNNTSSPSPSSTPTPSSSNANDESFWTSDDFLGWLMVLWALLLLFMIFFMILCCIEPRPEKRARSEEKEDSAREDDAEEEEEQDGSDEQLVQSNQSRNGKHYHSHHGRRKPQHIKPDPSGMARYFSATQEEGISMRKGNAFDGW